MKELPIMNAYENGWPIAYIVRGHRHLKKKGCAAGLLNWEAKTVSHTIVSLHIQPLIPTCIAQPRRFDFKRRPTLDVSEHPQ